MVFQDLNCLNRDLSRVIMIDWNKDAYKLNPDNGFHMEKWTGEMNDTALGELAEFLRGILLGSFYFHVLILSKQIIPF